MPTVEVCSQCGNKKCLCRECKKVGNICEMIFQKNCMFDPNSTEECWWPGKDKKEEE